MKMNKILLVMFCSLILLSGCKKQEDVAEVNDAIITKRNFNIAFNKEIIALHTSPETKDNFYTQNEIKQRAVKKLIVAEMILNKYQDYTASKDEIEKYKNEYKKINSLENDPNEEVDENQLNEEELNSYLEKKIKRKKILQEAGLYKATDEQLKQFYNDNLHLYRTEESYDVSHILLRTNYSEIKNRYLENDKNNKMKIDVLDKVIQDEIQKNTETLNKIKNTITVENFAKTAIKYSQDEETAPIGGNLGTLHNGDMSPKFIQQLQLQEAGTISPPVYTKYGTHLIYLRKKVPQSVKPFEEVKEDVRFRLMDNIEYDLFNDYIESQIKYANVKYFDETLKPNHTTFWDKLQKFFTNKKRKK